MKFSYSKGFTSVLIATIACVALQISIADRVLKPVDSGLVVKTKTNWEVRIARRDQKISDQKFEPLTHAKIHLPREFQGWIEYKARLVIPKENDGEPLSAFLGQVGDVDQTFLNGELIGATGIFPPRYQPRMEVFRNYILPDDLIKYGQENEFRILSYVEYIAQKGLDPTQFVVGKNSELSSTQFWEGFRWYSLKLFVPFLCLFLTLMAAPWVSRKELLKSNLLLLGISVCYFIFGVGKSRVIFYLLPQVFAYKLLTISALFGLVFIFIYTIDLVKMRSKFFYFLGVVIPVFFAIRILAAPDLIWASIRVKEWFVASTPLLLIIGLVSLFRARSQPLFIRAGLASLVAVALNDILAATKLIHNATIMDFGYCLFIGSMMMRQMIATKRGWVDLSLKQSELEWSKKLLKLSQQVAHDIRSPLSAMSFSLKKLRGSQKTDEIELLSQGVERLESVSSKLMNEYRSYYENDDKKSLPLMKLTLVDRFVSQVVEETKNIVSDNVQIIVEGLNSKPTTFAMIEPGEFCAALSNVLRNSVEALGANGTIRVRFSVDQKFVRIEILDNGKGIPADIMPKIFEDGFTHDKINGTGLGLFQAKRAIESFEGTFTLESTANVGTRVLIELPLEKKPPYIIDSLTLEKHKSIFLLESDPLLIDLWKQRFVDAGVSIRVAKLDDVALATDCIVLVNGDDVMERSLLERSETGSIDLIIYCRDFDDPAFQTRVQRAKASIVPRVWVSSFKIENSKKKRFSLLLNQEKHTQKAETLS